MTGIIPDPSSGGLPVRDGSGNPIVQPDVQNAYVPPASFAVSCQLNYLPSDCTARITAAQINAFQSEMLCLAVALNPNGTWDCTDTCNLSTALQFWITDTLPGLVADAICAVDPAAPTDFSLTSFVMCTPDGARQVTFGDVFNYENIGTALCGAPLGALDSLTRLIACDANGEPIKIDPAELLTEAIGGICLLAPAETYNGHSLLACGINGIARVNPGEVLGATLCASPEETPDADTRIIACDGDGNPIKIDPSELKDCFCPPVYAISPPSNPPDAGETPFWIDTSDPNNQVLYAWSGGLWVKIGHDSHILVGAYGINYPAVDPMPNTLPLPSDQQILATGSFTIPNSSPHTITVQLINVYHTGLRMFDTDGGTLDFTILPGSPPTGPNISSPHFVAAVPLHMFDTHPVEAVRYNVPPGGASFTTQMIARGFRNNSGRAAGGNLSQQVSWYGVYSPNRN